MLSVEEMQEPGGLNRILRLLEESLAETGCLFNTYRRQPGVSIAEYISTLKRLRSEYLAEDPDTVISDKAFGQRLLSRAALTRKERTVIFFSSGGACRSGPIAKVMRFRCSNVHLDERKTTGHEKSSRPSDDRVQYKKRSPNKNPPRRGDRRPARASHHAHVAEPVEPNEQDEPYDYEDDDEVVDDADDEDLEQEALLTYEEGDRRGESDDEDWEEDKPAGIEDLKDAYAAGWRAKQKTTDGRKARGYHQTGKGKGKEPRSGSRKTPDQWKRTSKCSSCGLHGDAECPNVKSGKDPPRQPKDTSGTYHASSMEAPSSRASASASARSDESGMTGVHRVNWTFPVTSTDGWDLLQEYSSEESGVEDHGWNLRSCAPAVPQGPGRELPRKKVPTRYG